MERYDRTSAESIFSYSKGLLGKTLAEAVYASDKNADTSIISKGGKGGLGQLVEELYFGYKANSSPEADFAEAGVELKTTPLTEKANGGYRIKERLICDMIDFCAIVDISFEESPFYKKCLLMLILFYLHKKNVAKCDLKFIYSVLWRLQGKDLEIIRHDYETIINKIKAGKAHELSEGDTMYLGAARKGQKGDPLRKQPFSEKNAPKRAFSLKPTYMRTVLDFVENSGSQIATNTDILLQEPQLVSAEELAQKPFEDIIRDRLLVFKGRDYKQIAAHFGEEISPKEKSKYSHASRLILNKGLKRVEDAEEIRKSGIILRNIRQQSNNSIRESISFKNIDYAEVLNAESFYESEWYEIATSKFLFIVYRQADVPDDCAAEWAEDKERYVLDDVIFWTMPPEELEIAEQYWNNIKENIAADKHYTEAGNTYWRATDRKCFHVRPKGKDASDLTPSPIKNRNVRKTCYWFNKDYVKDIVNKARQ